MNQFKIKRKANQLTQFKVAETLGINKSTVSKWENGECLPRAETLLSLANLYKCTTDDLLS